MKCVKHSIEWNATPTSKIARKWATWHSSRVDRFLFSLWYSRLVKQSQAWSAPELSFIQPYKPKLTLETMKHFSQIFGSTKELFLIEYEASLFIFIWRSLRSAHKKGLVPATSPRDQAPSCKLPISAKYLAVGTKIWSVRLVPQIQTSPQIMLVPSTKWK